MQRECQLLGTVAPVFTSDPASAHLHIISPVHQENMPHRTSSLTVGTGQSGTHRDVQHNEIILL